MVSCLHAMLQSLAMELKKASNPGDLLHSKLWERARSTNNAENINDLKLRGIAWSHICGTESDVAVEDVQRPPTVKAENASQDFHIVEELLKVAKSEYALGRTMEKKQLISELLPIAQAQLSVIPIKGMGGSGKTTLARLVYEDQEVQEHFEIKAWAKMDCGLDQAQLCSIARRLLKSATGVLCPLNSLVKLNEMVFDAFLSKRSLIVLDGVESMDTEAWLHMKNSWFSSVGFGSKLIITTSNEQVAHDNSNTFSLGKLSDNDSWSLYSSMAFAPSEETEQVRLMPVAQRLAARCNGVPLSLKLLGSLTRFEKRLLLEETSSVDLMEVITSFEDDSFVLALSVMALPEDLFKCFAYCGIFPYGYALDKEKLIKMWSADGLMKPSSIKSVEDIGEAYFDQLLCRSFFTDLTWEHGEIVQARMASRVYEISHQIAAIVFQKKVGYVGGVDKKSQLSLALPFEEAYSPRQLQTLVSVPAKNLHQVNLNPSFVELKSLRSLDLSRSGIRRLSKHFCTMRKLSYLNLSHTLLTALPKSFTNLTCLQTLDLSSCYYLKSLPKKMSCFSQLRHLDLSQCNSLSIMPSSIGSLVSLVTMTLYVIGDNDIKDGADLRKLQGLNDLRGVLHIRNLERVKEVSEARAACLQQKKLHRLGLSWNHRMEAHNECDEQVLESLRPNLELQILDITGYEGSGFPYWMSNLHSLVKLMINDCKCTKLPTLGQLPSLKELQLKELTNIKSIGEELYGYGDCVFPSLEKLKLHGMPNLNSWFNHSDSSCLVFPSLKRLSIQDCPELQRLPSSSLQCVTELVVRRSHSKILPALTEAGPPSISSLVMSDMAVKESFQGVSRAKSEKLIVVGCRDLHTLDSSDIDKFTGLRHLRILRCLKLRNVKLSHLGFVQKLNILDCQNLSHLDLHVEMFNLTELVVEDCPQLKRIGIKATGSGGSRLRKLIVRNCPEFSIKPHTIQEMRELEMIFVNGCPKVEEWLTSWETHVPFVVVGAKHSITNPSIKPPF